MMQLMNLKRFIFVFYFNWKDDDKTFDCLYLNVLILMNRTNYTRNGFDQFDWGKLKTRPSYVNKLIDVGFGWILF